MAEDEASSIGVVVGSPTAFGILGARIVDDVSGDGRPDLAVALTGATLEDGLGDGSIIASIDGEDCEWQATLGTPFGDVAIRLSSSRDGETDVFEVVLMNLSYEQDGRGIASITIPVAGGVTADSVKLMGQPEGWELDTALGALGGFATVAETEDGTGIRAGETASFEFVLPRTTDIERFQRDDVAGEHVRIPPGFLVDSCRMPLELLDAAPPPLASETTGMWTERLSAPSSGLCCEGAACKEKAVSCVELAEGYDICMQGTLEAEEGKSTITLEIAGCPRDPEIAPHGHHILVGLPIDADTEPQPGPLAGRSWVLEIPEWMLEARGIGVFKGGLDEQETQGSALVSLSWVFAAFTDLVRYQVTVLDNRTSEPIEGAAVTLGAHTRTTDSEGTCEFDVPPGEYVVKASASGYKPASKDVEVVPVPTDAGDRVLWGQNWTNMHLEPIEPVTATGQVYGAVLSPAGDPQAGVSVYLDGTLMVETDARGLFGFPAPVGAHTVTAGAPNATGGSAQQVTVVSGRAHEVLLLVD